MYLCTRYLLLLGAAAAPGDRLCLALRSSVPLFLAFFSLSLSLLSPALVCARQQDAPLSLFSLVRASMIPWSLTTETIFPKLHAREVCGGEKGPKQQVRVPSHEAAQQTNQRK